MALSITASVSSLLGASIPVFDASVASNMAVYWGQGANQDRLIETCKNNAFDIINIGFINTFPDATGYPGANFGNQCANTTYTVDGTATQLPNDCPYIEEDIILCQEVYGKKVLLSIGGAEPTDYYLKSEAEAIQFADFLWGAFGPNNDDYPRPFGSAVVDGFDFDIESSIDITTSADVPAAYKSQYYADMVNHFRGGCFDSSKTFYISGSPQCSFPDAHLADAVANAEFDFLFVQLYNTPACNARAELDGDSDVFANWLSSDFITSQSANPSVKIFIGLPASPDGAPSDPTAYLTPAEASTLLAKYSTTSSNFGGVMLWEATLDAATASLTALDLSSHTYSQWIKESLAGCLSISLSVDGDEITVFDDTCAFLDYSPLPLTGLVPSLNGTCGILTGYTCEGSAFGQCCSQYGNCGGGDDYCGVASGCDELFGLCGAAGETSSSAVASTLASSTSSIVSTLRLSTPAFSTSAVSTPASSTPTASTPVVSTQAVSTPAYSTPIMSTPVVSYPVGSTTEFSMSVVSTSSHSSTPAISTPVVSTAVALSSVSTTSMAPTPIVSSLSTPSSFQTPVATPSSPQSIGTERSSGPPTSTPSAVYSSTPSVWTPLSIYTPSVSISNSSTPLGLSGNTLLPTSTPVNSPTSLGFQLTSTTPVSSLIPSPVSSFVSDLSSSSSSVYTFSSMRGPYTNSSTIITPTSAASASSLFDESSTVITSTTKVSSIAVSSATTEVPSSGMITSSSASSTSSPASDDITTTVITTTYIDVCPTGLTTITTTYTTIICPSSTATPAIPSDWVTTTTICTVCGPSPTTLTLTKPLSPTATPATSAMTTSTVYTTSIITVTACPESITNCPLTLQTTATTTATIPLYTTILPISAIPSAAAVSSTATTATVNIAAASSAAMTTSTIYTTDFITVTACPPSVTNCPARHQVTSVSTNVVPVYTTVYPISAAPPSSTSPSSAVGGGSDTTVPAASGAIAIGTSPAVKGTTTITVLGGTVTLATTATTVKAVGGEETVTVTTGATATPAESSGSSAVGAVAVSTAAESQTTTVVLQISTMLVIPVPSPVPNHAVNGTAGSGGNGTAAVVGLGTSLTVRPTRLVAAVETSGAVVPSQVSYTGAAAAPGVGVSGIVLAVLGVVCVFAVGV